MSSGQARGSPDGVLGNMCALRLDVDGVQRLAGGHEQAVAFGAAEADVAADLRQQDLADARAVGGEDVDAVVAVADPAGAAQMLPSMSQRMPSAKPATLLAVRVCIFIEANSRPLRELPAVVDDVPDLDVLRRVGVVRGAGVGDVELLVVGREAEAVRLEDLVAVDQLVDLAGLGVDAVDGFLELQLALVALRSSSGCRSRDR